MLIVRICRLFRQHYAVISGSAVVLAGIMYFAVVVLFPPKYGASAAIFIPKQAATPLKIKTEWEPQPVTATDLTRLINDREIQKEIGLKLQKSRLTLHNDSSAAISAVKTVNGDVIALSCASDNAELCRQTLTLFLDTCMLHYQNINKNRIDKIAAYYTDQFQNAENALRLSEENLPGQHTGVAGHEAVLKQLLAEREKMSELETAMKSIENQIGTNNPVVKNQAVIEKQQILADSYKQLTVSAVNDAKTDTVFLQMQVKHTQDELKQAIAAMIAALPGDEETKDKVTKEYGNALISAEQNKARIAALEYRRDAWYTQPAFAKLPPQTLEELKNNGRNYLNALDELRKSNRYQQAQLAAQPFQITEKPDCRVVGINMGIAGIALCSIAGFILSFAAAALITVFNKKLQTPERTEQMTGLKIAGIIPDEKQLQTCGNANHIRNSLLYRMLWDMFRTQKHRRILVASIYPEDGKTFVCDTISQWLSRKGRKCRVVTPRFEKGMWWVKPSTSDSLIPLEMLTDSEVVIMKLPPLTTGEYPVELIRKFNMSFLVCNANRKWSQADRKVLDYFVEQSKLVPQAVLNRVGLHAVEDMLGTINVDKTYHASAKRSTQAAVLREHKTIRNSRQAQQIVKTMPNLGVILNKNRQIVYANKAITSMLGLGGMNKTLGLRPGELVSCVYSDMTAAGCGTSKACQNCGAVNTITRCIKSQQHEEGECQINSFMDGQLVPFKFKITCSPFKVNNEFFVITNLADIRGEEDKRKQMLTKTMAGAESNNDLSALSELIGQVDENGQLDSLISTLKQTTTSMTEEIIEYQRLLDVGKGDLKVHLASAGAFNILDNAVHSVRTQKIAQDKDISLAPPFPAISLMTDAAILEQILRSMLRNAVEAVPAGGIVYTGYERTKHAITFYVFNEGMIPEHIQGQIFRKEFTTKEKGRGFGTYSMKLLGERCLRGHVGFKSAQESGTRFFVTLPMAE